MTALTEYQRLESAAVWRASPDEQRRDVYVSVGDATLIVTDGAGRAITHWSLPALLRLNPGQRPAVYAPGEDAPEQLEIEDDLMVSSIEKVRTTVRRRRPQPGRLRFFLLGGGLLAMLALSVFWLPDAMVRHTATVIPQAARAELGQRLLSHIRRVAGPPCDTLRGRRALDLMKSRLMAEAPGRIVVLRGGVEGAQHLPGGVILVNRALVEDYEDPSVVAGYVLAELARARAEDPVLRLLKDAGVLVAFRLLTTGSVKDAVLAAHAEALLLRPPASVPDETLLADFAAAGVASTPYAYARDISGETTLALIEADPATDAEAAPVLTDGQWVSLQGICGE